MTRIFITIFIFVFTFSANAQRIRFEIRNLPTAHIAGSDIFVAGSFNNWNPQEANYKFQKGDKGNYFLELKLNPGKYEYKITRGGWDKVECKQSGAGIENRQLILFTDTTIELSIEGWADQFPSKPRVSTANTNVKIIDTAFWIPQLKRTRRVWIYLPENYTTPQKYRFPVLYMHDGQNVFDNATSFSGEWGVDEFLDTAFLKTCIVVAIDHGGNKRLNEYNPYENKQFGKGEGNEYVDFLANTLKPFIDKNYRTAKDKKNTFIAGSSMGGLISLYAVLKYPKVFGGAGIFSPAFWVAPQIYKDIKTKGKNVNSNIYFYAGKQEGASMVPDMLKAFGEMSKVSKSKMRIVIRHEGKHNELTWRKEFPEGYIWMLYPN